MSFLQKLISASEQTDLEKDAMLVECHYLISEPVEVRMDYLAACIFSFEGEQISQLIDSRAFKSLVKGLNISEAQVQTIVLDLATFDEKKITQIFASLREQDLAALYFLDLTWLQGMTSADGGNESASTRVIAKIIGLSIMDVKAICAFVLARREGNNAKLIKAIPTLPSSVRLHAALPDILKVSFPYGGLMYGRWIDHGDGTMTDTESSLMWSRCLLGQEWNEGVVTGKPIETEYPRRIIRNTNVADASIGDDCHEEFVLALKSLTLSQKIQFKDWQLVSFGDHFESIQDCFTSEELMRQLFVGAATVGAEFTTVNGGDGVHQYVGACAQKSYALLYRNWLKESCA